jgi:simple sugar transport system ATP-binding protein
LVKEGHTAIFITHKLYEVSRICQRATVLRRGKVVGVVAVASTPPAELARMMVGHEVTPVRSERLTATSATARAPDRLVLRSVNADDDRGLHVLRNLSLTVGAGEIVGVAGVEGNGQHELLEVLVGKRQNRSGDIIMAGNKIDALTTRQRRSRGLAVIPEDRNREGLSKLMTIPENLIATRYFTPPQSRLGILDGAHIGAMAGQLLQQFDVRTGSAVATAGSLSGGNAQKVVIARELRDQPSVLIAAQPTRGLDIGATKFVHVQLLERRAAGMGILLISADLDELLALSDRIAVIFRGEIIRTLVGADATREQLGLWMSGKQSEREGVSG